MKCQSSSFGEDLVNCEPGSRFVPGCRAPVSLIVALRSYAMTKTTSSPAEALFTIAQLAYVTSVGAMLANEGRLSRRQYQIAADAVGKMTLFMCAGAIYVRTLGHNISDMRVSAERMPMGMSLLSSSRHLSIHRHPPMAGSWAR